MQIQWTNFESIFSPVPWGLLTFLKLITMQLTALNIFYHCHNITTLRILPCLLTLLRHIDLRGECNGGWVLLWGARIASDSPTLCPGQVILTSHGKIPSVSENMILWHGTWKPQWRSKKRRPLLGNGLLKHVPSATNYCGNGFLTKAYPW
jgi:hypothetical protein